MLRLLEKHPLTQLRPAVEQGLKAGALTRDALAQFLYPHLQHVKVTAPDVTQYETLLGGGR